MDLSNSSGEMIEPIGKIILYLTTTLLLAYSGSYVTFLMVFIAQGTLIDHVWNYQ